MPETDAEKFRMQYAGLVARSAQGHAAKGMKIKDQEDMWVSIQHNTFKNWVNVQLRDTGLRVEDLSEDLKDGVALVTLVETLQKRRLKKVKRVLNQHQALENVTTALNAISQDGIKLVNIGNVDIVNGNLKLILGLIWSLIMHYQIGQTKLPPKKIMLAWLKAVLPECRVTNFTSDWNTGIHLSALLDYCRPGLFSNWKHLNPHDSVDNCRRAMEIAHDEFQIPMVLEPEYLASPYLDDLSGMTYLSYFMKEGGPGYKATMNWVRNQLPQKHIKNFTTDWNDGHNLAALVKKLGGPVRGYKNMPKDMNSWENNIENCFEGGRKLGVEPVLAASDMSKPDVDHLGPMAYIAYYQWVRPRKSPSECLKVHCDIDNVRINNPVPFKIDFLSNEVVVSEIKVEVTGPSGPVRTQVDLGPRGGKGSFTPKEVGFYELNIYNENELVEGCPFKVRALPDVSKIMFSGIDPCALGSIVEVLINSNGAGGGEIDVSALSPTNRSLHCPVKVEDGVYTATFQPDEAGEWSIGVSYEDEHIQGSPFTCQVYDPNAIKVRNLDEGTLSSPGQPFTFVVDARACGWGEVKIDVTCGGRSEPSRTLEVDRSLYEVTFTPFEAAKYKVYVYFNGHEVRGSPFALYLGVDKPPERKSKSKKKSKNKDKKESDPIIKEYKSTVASPFLGSLNHSNHNNIVKTYDSSELNTSRSSKLNKSFEDIDAKYNKGFYSSLERNKDSYASKNDSILDRNASRTHSSPLNKYSTSSLSKKQYFSDDKSYNTSSLTRRDYESSSSFREANTSSHRRSFERSISPPMDSPRKSSFERSTSPSDRGSPRRSIFDFSSPPKESSPRSPSYEISPKRSDRFNSLNQNSFDDSTFNSTYESSFNTSATTVIDRGSHSRTRFGSPSDNNYSHTLDSTSKISHLIRSSKSPPASPNHLSPYESMRNSPIRHTSPPASVPDAASALSSPAKVLQISQNAAKTSEGSSFYYSSVANMKILPSTY